MSGIVGSYFNTRGSGVVAKLGTDGQVFTSTGAGLSQGFEAAGGGAFTKISSQTASAVDQIDFTSSHLTTSYQDYMLILSGLKPGSDSQDLLFRVSTDGGSSFKTGSDYAYGIGGEDAQSDFETASSQASAFFRLNTSTFGNATGEVGSSIIHLFDPLNVNSDSQYFHYTSSTLSLNAVATPQPAWGGGIYDESGAEDSVINGIRVYFASGTIATGKLTLYGRTA